MQASFSVVRATLGKKKGHKGRRAGDAGKYRYFINRHFT
jgi:hypothetical protein